MTSFKNKLIKMNACQDAVDWVGNRGLKRAWHESTRADRMLWLCDKLGIDKKLVVLAGCDCAETALQFVPEGEDAPANTLQVTRNWCAGKATLQEVKDADDTVSYPYPDAYPAAVRAAFRAAGEAASTASHAAHAAYAASTASHAAAYAANAAGSARKKAQRTCADLVRARIPFELVQKAMKEMK